LQEATPSAAGTPVKPTPSPDNHSSAQKSHSKGRNQHGTARGQLWLIAVSIFIVGNLEVDSMIVDAPQRIVSKAPATAHRPGAKQIPSEGRGDVYFTDSDGKIRLTATVGEGPALIYVTSAGKIPSVYPVHQAAFLLINTECGGAIGAPVSKLKLIPSKAYRHCDDPLTITALAVDANNDPVSGANVAFSVFGDCHPAGEKIVKTTAANGIASITVESHVPGVDSIVAAVDVNGAPVLSDPAHVHYFEERSCCAHSMGVVHERIVCSFLGFMVRHVLCG
jgi:hypothetical protein